MPKEHVVRHNEVHDSVEAGRREMKNLEGVMVEMARWRDGPIFPLTTHVRPTNRLVASRVRSMTKSRRRATSSGTCGRT